MAPGLLSAAEEESQRRFNVAGPAAEERIPAGMPLLVTENGYCTQNESEAAKNESAGRCTGGAYFQQRCSHGNWRWTFRPCQQFDCEACHKWRVNHELVPQIVAALAQARQKRETLKHMVLTWQGDDLGAQDTPEGAERRRLDVQHLWQYIRRDLGFKAEYLRIAETHKSGRIHFHFIGIMPHVDQKKLSARWKKFARGSYIVWVDACFLPCPRCWDSGLSKREKRRRRIVPWPGTSKCENCGLDMTGVDNTEALRVGSWQVPEQDGEHRRYREKIEQMARLAEG